VEAREGGNKAGDPVRPQPQVLDVEVHRVGEATEEVGGGVRFPTAAFGTGWVYGWVYAVLVAVQSLAAP